MEGSKHVFIGNLLWETTSEQLLSFLMTSGDVVSAKVQRHEDTKRSKGWGLAEFGSPEAALKAVQTLDGRMFNGRKVHLKLDRRSDEAETKVSTSSNVFVGNIPWSTSPAQLLELFAPFNPMECEILTNMYGRSRGFAIIKFRSNSDAERSIQALNHIDFEGRTIECRHDRGPARAREENVRDSVFVRMGAALDDAQLYTLFARIGPIVSATIQRHPTGKSKGWGIVKFQQPEHAQLAVDLMNGYRLHNNHNSLEVHLDRK